MYPITMIISQNCLKGFPKSVVQSLGHVQLFCNPMDCISPGSFVHGNSPGKNTRVGCHALVQRIFPTKGSNPGLLHCRRILYQRLTFYKTDSSTVSQQDIDINIVKIQSSSISTVQFSSVAQLCLTLCDPMDRSTPGFLVLHHLPELALTHVHRVCDAIQSFHPLLSPSPPAFNLSQHQGLFQ